MRTYRIELDLYGQGLAGDKRRPSEVMKDFGIVYETAEGSSFHDAFIFTGCTNVPSDLPEWLSAREEK